MPRVTDTTIIQNNAFTLDPAGLTVQPLALSLPAGFVPGSRPILVYRMEPVNGVALVWGIEINGTRIESYNLTGTAFRALHLIVQDNVLQVGNNLVEFKVEPNQGSGQLIFSGVYLLWQNDL